MGVRFPTAITTTVIGAPGAAGAEAAVMTSAPLNITLDNAPVFLWWYCDPGVGTGTTSYFARIRRGSGITGTSILATANITVTASANVICSGCLVDTPGIVAGQQYTLSLTGTGTTGAWTLPANAVLIAVAL